MSGPPPSFTLRVRVVAGSNLQCPSPAPIPWVQLAPGRGGFFSPQVMNTKHAQGPAPAWHETFDVPIADPAQDVLKVTLYDHAAQAQVGEGIAQLAALRGPGVDNEQWVTVAGPQGPRGGIQLILTPINFGVGGASPMMTAQVGVMHTPPPHGAPMGGPPPGPMGGPPPGHMGGPPPGGVVMTGPPPGHGAPPPGYGAPPPQHKVVMTGAPPPQQQTVVVAGGHPPGPGYHHPPPHGHQTVVVAGHGHGKFKKGKWKQKKFKHKKFKYKAPKLKIGKFKHKFKW